MSWNCYNNHTGQICFVQVYGGTVTAISRNGYDLSMTSGAIALMPSDTITLTYSSTPSWRWTSLD